MNDKKLKKAKKNLLKDLNNAYSSLKESYKVIQKEIKNGGLKTGASEWILDNTYLLEREFKFVKKNLPEEYLLDLPIDLERSYKLESKEENKKKKKSRCDDKSVLPRVYTLVKKIIDNRVPIKAENLSEFILEKNDSLIYGEVISIPIMLKICLLIKICNEVKKVEEFYKSKEEHKDIFINEKLEEEIERSISSLRELDNVDWAYVFRNISKLEKTLEKDPSGTYLIMDEDSKDYYRHKVEDIAKKNELNQNIVVEAALNLAKKAKVSGGEIYTTHIGYYLCDEGYKELLNELKITTIENPDSEGRFILWNIFGTILLALGVIIFSALFEWPYNTLRDYILSFFIILLPCSEMIVAWINYRTPKSHKLNHIPKINFENGIGEENRTVVVIPTMFESKKKIDKLIKNIEVTYLGNKDKEAFFVILGDFEDNKNEFCEIEQELNNYGKEKIDYLNKKYIKDIENRDGKDIFFMATRTRIYDKSEGKYIGWERKRGKLVEFMNLLRGGTKTTFSFFSGNIEDIKSAKYLITLDTDTFMKRNTLKKLVGAMVHPLNNPKVSNGKVVRGYGMLQPKVSISLESKNKTYFSKIFAGDSGVDGYSTAYSDTYQDRFKKGSFTGKGILHINSFMKTITGKIEEDSILSHDLLEGELNRCGLITDCEFIEEYPKTYFSSVIRLHRWVRGDWQLIKWLFSRDLKAISKWKIFDNLRRSLLSPWLLFGLWISLTFLNRGKGVVTILFLAVIAPILFRVTDFVVTPKHKLNGSGKTLVQVLFILSFIPYQTYIMLSAIFKTLGRVFITKKHLLEWRASDIADRDEKTTISFYYSKMWFSVVSGIITMILSFVAMEEIAAFTFWIGILWILSPYLAYSISKEDEEEILKTEEMDYLFNIAKDTWKYYDDLINEENNWLPPDNYQEEPFRGDAKRTSPTNIGLALMANVVAYDLNFIGIKDAVYRINKTLKSMDELERWHGHFLNWYDIQNKNPLMPRYISTVDSGNLLSYLMIVKEFILENAKEESETIELLNKFIDEMNFKELYDEKKDLFYIGYNLEEDSFGKAHYDLLASEARVASFLAIARGEVDESHWFKLRRGCRSIFMKKTLLSWSGTMFEYLMPSLIMKNFKGSVLDSTYEGVLSAQINYGRRKKVPFGISESAFYKFDLEKNYQYKAFGVPSLRMKREVEEEIVVSPYSSLMGLQFEREKCIKNLRIMQDEGAYGKYGFIESIDYTPNRINKLLKEEVISEEIESIPENKKRKNGLLIKTYMVHHLGMSLLALDNILKNNIMINRFHNIPEVKATELLLKEKKDNLYEGERGALINEEFKVKTNIFSERIITDSDILDKDVNILSNGRYSVMLNTLGGGYSKCENDLLYRWGGDFLSEEGGVLFYIKDMKDGNVQSPTYYPFNNIGEKYKVRFSLEKSEIHKIENSIDTTLRILISGENNIEIRKLKIKNLRDENLELEVTSYLEPILTTLEGDLAHTTFSNLFIETEFLNGENVIIGKRRVRRKEDDEKYIFTTLFLLDEDDDKERIQYETRRENFIRRNGNLKDPIGLEKELDNEASAPLDPIIAMRRKLKLEKGEEKTLCLIIGYTMDKGEIVKKIKEHKSSKDLVSLKRKYNKMASILLNKISINSEKANLYEKILKEILYIGGNRKYRESFIKNINMHQEDLWRYGISGDKKILLLKYNKNKYLLKDMVSLHYYLEIKGVELDLIIYNNEETDYYNTNRREIDRWIRAIRGDEIKNIFVFNKEQLDEEFFNFLIGICSIYVDEEEDKDLESKIKLLQRYSDLNREIEKDCKYLLHLNDIKVEEEELDEIKGEIEDSTSDNLDFFNGYGGFNKEDGSYVIKLKNKENTPRPWINVLSNKNFGTHISESGASYTWCGNSRENKITPWSNDYIKDPMYEGIWMKDNTDQDLFSIFKKPFDDGEEYVVNHNFGFSTFKHRHICIEGSITVFVPRNEDLKLQIIKLKNVSEEEKSISVFYYNELAMSENKRKDSEKIYTGINEEYAYGKNPYSKSFGKKIAYSTIIGDGKNSYTCDIEEAQKTLIETWEENLSERCGGSYRPCLLTQKNIVLDIGEEITLIGILGEEESFEAIDEKIQKYKNIDKVFEELNELKVELDNFLGNIKVNTGDKSFDYMMNGWLLYQNYNCRYLSRTAFYQSGGAYGFRDQMQDSLALAISRPEILREQIIKNASRQYIEGDVQHWWHPIVNSGIRTRFSDDLLWMPYGVIEYIRLTGDKSILTEKAPYLDDSPLREGEDERYTVVNNLLPEDSIYNHCIKAIDKSLKFGSNGIPLMGSGDWNDGMSTVGNKGKGESVWLGWFLAEILKEFIPICEYMNEEERGREYKNTLDTLVQNIELNAWDGEWYRRAFFDDGTPLGSKENDECFIDSLSQSFSIISGLGSKERGKKAMESVEKYLVDKENGLIKLLHPPFAKSKLEPGYIKGYVPGVRENGGQYTHAAIWVILAFSKLRENNKAYGFYSMINPISHTKTKEDADKYKVEPYVMSADVYIKKPYEGRGGWSYYTGAAGWMYKVGLQNILGFNVIEGKGYSIKPNLPNYIDEFSIEIKEEKYKIHVKRSNENKIIINGKEINGDIIEKGLGESFIEVEFKE
ncbi:GH36-type glycosyl hydrolase domain-containing protein [Clostridium thermobutyricum]